MISQKLKDFVRAMSLEGMAIPKAHPPGGDTGGSSNFSIEDLADCYRINGVHYKNGTDQVDAAKALLPSGTQEEHAQRRKEALKTNSFYAPDFPLFHGIINALYQHREGPFKDKIEAAKKSLSDLVNNRWLMMLTRVRYNPQGQDSVIHNYGQDDQYEIQSDIVGPDGLIAKQETSAGTALQALLSTTQSPQEIDQIYRWFSGKDSYICRVNRRPRSIDERVARFDADSDGSSFVCYSGLQYSFASFGVRRRASAASGS